MYERTVAHYVIRPFTKSSRRTVYNSAIKLISGIFVSSLILSQDFSALLVMHSGSAESMRHRTGAPSLPPSINHPRRRFLAHTQPVCTQCSHRSRSLSPAAPSPPHPPPPHPLTLHLSHRGREEVVRALAGPCSTVGSDRATSWPWTSRAING